MYIRDYSDNDLKPWRGEGVLLLRDPRFKFSDLQSNFQSARKYKLVLDSTSFPSQNRTAPVHGGWT
jgi:hypothetical protein